MKGNAMLAASARSDVGVISITSGAPKNPSVRIRLIGASMWTSVEPGEWVTSFSLEMEDGVNNGVVAVKAEMFNGDVSCCLVPVRREEGNPQMIRIALDEHFIPEKGRLGQIYSDGKIEVRVGNVIYTNRYDHKDELTPNSNEYRLVDADSLCKYMVSHVDVKELDRVSEGRVHSISQESCIESLRVEKRRLREDVTGLIKKLEEETTAHMQALTHARGFVAFVGAQWYLRFKGTRWIFASLYDDMLSMRKKFGMQ